VRLLDQAAQIRAIADHVRAVDPDDEQLLADMIEAETDLDSLLDMLIEREATCKAHIEANKARKKALDDRNRRFQAGIDAGRGAMQKLLDAANLRKWERPEATIGLRAVPPSLIAGDVDNLPDDLCRITRAPDAALVKDAIKSGADLPGWSMSNGSETVSVRRA